MTSKTERWQDTTYTLIGIERGGHTEYTLSVTQEGDAPCVLENFTENKCLAEAFLSLLFRNHIPPKRARVVWEDMQISRP